MKNAFVYLAFIVASLSGCSKDNEDSTSPKNFEEINRSHIVAAATILQTDDIMASNTGGVIWKAGDVFIFKNRVGMYGKLRVVSIDIPVNYALTIDAVLYNADGSIAENTPGLLIAGTWLCDLAILAETNTMANSDFHWSRENATNTQLVPMNGARFAKYMY